MADLFRQVDVTRVRGGVRAHERDHAATEEPLEIRLHGRSFAVVMRTPGADPELAAGFLFSESVLVAPGDLGTIEHCTDTSAEHRGNIVNVTLVNGSASALERLFEGRRHVITSAACGLCGRTTIASLATRAPRVDAPLTIAASTLSGLPDRLRPAQNAFHQTGGLHAAGLFRPDGGLDDLAEDVGRHNAVDKVIGRKLMRDALPLSDLLLCVSGRTSFEIVQKAFLAGIPMIAAVSAPSTLAIELADEAGVTLVGFVRDGRFNIYTHPFRVA